MKKKLNNLLFIALSLILVTACYDDDDDQVIPIPEPTPDYTQPKPVWNVSPSSSYDATMTSIVVLPDILQEHAQSSDLLAVFINNECRGVGSLVKKDNKYYYFLTIKGFNDEQGKITFKYYNTKQSYLYATGAILDFEPDGIWGVIDDPIILNGLTLVTS